MGAWRTRHIADATVGEVGSAGKTGARPLHKEAGTTVGGAGDTVDFVDGGSCGQTIGHYNTVEYPFPGIAVHSI